jgi:hypothetical protein
MGSGETPHHSPKDDLPNILENLEINNSIEENRIHDNSFSS